MQTTESGLPRPPKGDDSIDALKARQEFLNSHGHDVSALSPHHLKSEDVKGNIENFMGTIEIPLGMVGPLTLDAEKNDHIFTALATSEGALIASVNRGVRALNKSGGFNAMIVDQCMHRSPLFTFNNLHEVQRFVKFVNKNMETIKSSVKLYSNHAKLKEIRPLIMGRMVHMTFSYATGDASGQNMTTTCTWNICQALMEQFEAYSGIKVKDFILESNASSDKKISQANMILGRGIRVVVEATITYEEFKKSLKCNPRDFYNMYHRSYTAASHQGMMGYNVNVVNVIAAIFASTGQDLASIYESGHGLLYVEDLKDEESLYISLVLPNLIIGTVGGGTGLKGQNQVLSMMGCTGFGSVERLAKIIGGLCLGLELSTGAAMSSGQFANAHEKLGKNKPKNWLLKKEFNQDNIKKHLNLKDIKKIEFADSKLINNGIITDLASRVSKKLIGFIPLKIDSDRGEDTIIAKSKAMDNEIFNGFHFISNAVDPSLATEFSKWKDHFEYKDCHRKEMAIYKLLDKYGFNLTPKYFGEWVDHDREIYILFIDYMNKKNLKIHNSENNPELWNKDWRLAIDGINQFHQLTAGVQLDSISEVDYKGSEPFYAKIIQTILDEYSSMPEVTHLKSIFEAWKKNETSPYKTIIHNDFNPRNIAVTNEDKIMIYDWELAQIGTPHRDIVEFMTFIIDEKSDTEILEIIDYHANLSLESWNTDKVQWMAEYKRSLEDFIVTRLSFYLIGNLVMNYKFLRRVIINALRLHRLLP